MTLIVYVFRIILDSIGFYYKIEKTYNSQIKITYHPISHHVPSHYSTRGS